MISLIFTALLVFALAAAILAALLLIFVLCYIPVVSWSDGNTRLSYRTFRALYEAAPDEWINRWEGATYKGQALWIDCYFVGVGQLCYWAWYLRRQLAQRRAEKQDTLERMAKDIQEKQKTEVTS